MRRTALPLIVGVVTLWSLPAAAADRLTDKDVKQLVSRIEQGRDRFDDALEDRIKNEIVRGPGGEVNVKNFLNDFQRNIDNLEGRLKPEYAASAEVNTLLRQATSIERFFKQQPAGTRGESEWNKLATDLKTLASAYGTDFPLPENANVRRVGDGELAAGIEQLAKSADQVKKSLNNELKNDKTVDQATREAIVDEADQFTKDAKALRNRVKDGQPSSAEAEALLTRAAKLNDFIKSRQLPSSAAAWSGAGTRLQTIAGAYGAPWPGK
jgi:hypothetical protein